MLETIYSSLELVILILSIIYIIFISVLFAKKSYNDIASVKVQIVFLLIGCALWIFKVIICVIVAKSMGIDILGAVVWGMLTVTHVMRLKDAKGKVLEDKKSKDEIEYL